MRASRLFRQAAPTNLAATRANPTTKAQRHEGFLRLCLSAFFISISISISIGHARILNVPEEFGTIQAGIDAAEPGDTVLVGPGVYRENLVIEDRNIVLGSKILITNATTYIDSTVIDGNEEGSVIIVRGRDESSIIRGFTIRNGRQQFGGGIYCFDSTRPEFEDLLVTNNRAEMNGGGIHAEGYSQPVFRRVKITGNHSDNLGGAANFAVSSPIFIDCSITGNSSRVIPGINAAVQTISMTRTQITGNVNEWHTEAVFISLSNGEGRATLDYVTIAGNEPDENGIGAIFIAGGETTISNSIIYGNGSDELLINRSGQLFISHTDVLGGEANVILGDSSRLNWGDGNIDSDPLFLDPDNGDYHLSADSPCIDAGDPDSPLDPDGTRADMGAFYFHQRDIAVEPGEIHFAPIGWGEMDSMDLLVGNEGGTALWITSVQLPNDMSCFAVRPEIGEGQDSIQIAPDSIFTVWLFFNPDSNGGPLETILRIGSNDPDEEEVLIPVVGEVLAVPSDNLQPAIFNLQSAYPNPFNSSTTIRFSTGSISQGATKLAVYDLTGREVARLLYTQGLRHSGTQALAWNAEGQPGGVYIVRLETGGRSMARKVVLLR